MIYKKTLTVLLSAAIVTGAGAAALLGSGGSNQQAHSTPNKVDPATDHSDSASDVASPATVGGQNESERSTTPSRNANDGKTNDNDSNQKDDRSEEGKVGDRDYVPVPQVMSETETEAKRTIRQVGLRAEVLLVYVTRPGAEGVVLRQHPAPGDRVPRGSDVRIEVAAFDQAKLRNVPAVLGTSEADAISRVKARDLVPLVVEYVKVTTEARAGVMQVSPKAGTVVVAGDKVELTVGYWVPPVVQPKPKLVHVPGVVGLTWHDARQTIEGGQLVATFELRWVAGCSPGIVHSQSLGGGDQVPVGTQVRLIVCE
jgi:beta-lactam-binding protein with PASTA domain